MTGCQSLSQRKLFIIFFFFFAFSKIEGTPSQIVDKALETLDDNSLYDILSFNSEEYQ